MFAAVQLGDRRPPYVYLAVLVCLLGASSASAQDHDHEQAGKALHFSHPLVSESPSPDTKLRVDYGLTKESEEGDALIHRARLGAEYAPFRWLSFEFNLPYVIADRDDEANRHNLDNIEAAIKLASFVLEDQGMLLGGGLELGLPTGNSSNGIGSDRLVEIEPFVDVGVELGPFEGIGFLKFGFPANGNSEDADWELGWNVSLLHHTTPWLETILEFDGGRAWGGEEDGETVAHVSPGLKLIPLSDHDLAIGSAISLPITNDEEFDLRWIFSIFYHF